MSDNNKNEAKRKRSVFKLDNNFHLYIHNPDALLEKGYDEEKKMHFYKVFFKEEN